MAASPSRSFSFNNTLKDPYPTSLSSPVPTKPPKSMFPFTHYFFSKSLIIILVLLVFSFFPSQVPEIFKKTTIITKLWELFYLLVIGIAVCYGLFSRKMDSVHSSDELAHSDGNIGAKETYLSGISHISSIFEDGVQTSYGFDEKDSFEECKGSGSRFSEFGNGFVKSDGKKLNQYFLGESMVVIDDEKYVLEQLSKPNTNKPLCLPVRSLGSKSLDSAAGKSSNGGGGCSSVVKDPSPGWAGMKNQKFRGLVPIKLEEKFKETDSDSPTPLNWRSKSMRLEKREDLCATEANETSHFRPLSVGVLDFDGIRSKSRRFSMPSQIQNSSGKEESKGMETNHVFRKPYKDGETSFIESKPQDFSIGTAHETSDLRSHESLQDFVKTKVDDGREVSNCDASVFKAKTLHGSFKEKIGKINLKTKHQGPSVGASSEMNLKTFGEKTDSSNAGKGNTYKRGKSVRTNRPKEQVVEAKVRTFPRDADEQAERGSKLGRNVNVDDGGNTGGDSLSDTEAHSGEVDRKADEFIAKFRQQIRLQQVASAKRLNLR